MNNASSSPGLLTEDCNTLEVFQDGQQKLLRVLDREQSAKTLRESTAPDAAKPLHEG